MTLGERAGRRSVPVPRSEDMPELVGETSPVPAVVVPARAKRGAGLDSLLSALVAEMPVVRAPVRAAAAVEGPLPVAVPVRSSVRWGRLAFGLASTAALVLLAFAPGVRARIAAPAVRVDGSPAPAADGFESWANRRDGDYLI